VYGISQKTQCVKLLVCADYLLGLVLGAGALSVGAGAGGTGTEEALPSMTEVLERTMAFLLK
jgi:hypothetical protein